MSAEREREEGDAGAEEAGKIEPLLGRGVPGLPDDQAGDDDPDDPDGTLTKKIQFQLNVLRDQAPASGPMARAIADTPAQIPIAIPRSRGGNVAVMIDSVAGFITRPAPWRTRAPMRELGGPGEPAEERRDREDPRGRSRRCGAGRTCRRAFRR